MQQNPAYPEVIQYQTDTPRFCLIFLPYTPTSINKLFGSKGRSFKKSKEVKKWAKDLFYLAYKNKIHTFEKAQVSYVFNFPDNRRRDAENFIKIPNDALVKSEILKDDCYSLIGNPIVEIKKDNPSTIILIEEVI